MKNAFARDAQGNIKHKQPCQTKGCNWPNWHVCLDKTDPAHTRLHLPKRTTAGRKLSREHREAIAESQRARHARNRTLSNA